MDETAFSDLVSRARRSVPGAAVPSRALDAELEELLRLARASGATDEELALAVYALLATTRNPAGTP